jgi:hypothetical protein
VADLTWPWNLLGVIVVPVLVALLAPLWPWWQQRQRRATFQRLVHTELLEASPEPVKSGTASTWTAYLTRRFLHQQLISEPTLNATVVLSLSPKLSYNLAQLWSTFHRAEATFAAEELDEAAVVRDANQWCWYLRATCAYLDRYRRYGNLFRPRQRVSPIACQWHELLSEHYPSVPSVSEHHPSVSSDCDSEHRHLPPVSAATPPQPAPTAVVAPTSPVST